MGEHQPANWVASSTSFRGAAEYIRSLGASLWHTFSSYSASVPWRRMEETGKGLWVLGQHFDTSIRSPSPDVRTKFESRLWFTYRYGFPELRSLSSDIGWGCMLRSGQSLMAQALVRLLLGSRWPESECWSSFGVDSNGFKQYNKILRAFADEPEAPFSIHRIAERGEKYDKTVGQWFGPNTLANVLRDIASEQDEFCIRIYVCNSGALYTKIARRTAMGSGTWKPLVVLAPLRLGIEKFNPTYIPALTKCFESDLTIGMAGGRPNSSLYLIGTDGMRLLYLDPHESQPYTEDLKEDHRSFHCRTMRFVDATDIDPSVLIGFICESEADFDSLVMFLSQSCHAIIHVGEDPPEAVELEDMDDAFEI